MGKKSSPKPPKSVDPYEVAQADAEFNRINQVTPYGNLTFSGPNRNTATLNLTPEIQQLFDTRIGADQSMLDIAMRRMGDFDQRPINLDDYGAIQSDAGLGEFNPQGLPELPGDMESYRNRMEDAFFQRSRRLLDPEFRRQEETLRDTLANQGLPNTSDAFLDQFSQFNTDRGNTYANLADQSVLYSGQEASRMLADALAQRGQLYGEQYQGTAFNNAVRQQALQNQNAGRVQALQESLGIRGNQFNELASLLGLQQVQPAQMQNFFGPGQTDFLGSQALQAQQDMAKYQAKLGNYSAGLGGLFGLGSSALIGAGDAGGFKSLFKG
jgi:hypothetical protein